MFECIFKRKPNRSKEIENEIMDITGGHGMGKIVNGCDVILNGYFEIDELKRILSLLEGFRDCKNDEIVNSK